ncbi:hypothetical protein AFULGI_00009470 [Archaeoglobus fulgidus DSM 8774]|uniref:Uncharacterized protein n=2 Tax=Archaeoglobus fulgidus TaxID=2234 RepID=A0A075WJI3_ARCFL|nr:hypothetical protein AFULGI_00009470 [Archaeoglobus fulgidus DSM 8774]
MESDILRAGWGAWRRNPVTAVPFVLHGLSVIAVSIATLLSAIYAIMPELPAAILSGDFGDEAFKQMFGEFLKRCLGNIELLGVTFVFGLVIVALLLRCLKPGGLSFATTLLRARPYSLQRFTTRNPASFLCSNSSLFLRY